MADEEANSIVLFYQYIEPAWSEGEHGQKLKWLIGLCKQLRITGRGRVACEGVNCTLTGRSDDIRRLCLRMRQEEGCFQETDFKVTEGLRRGQLFKALTLRKTTELVGYGLETSLAPSLKKSKARHVQANEFHEILKSPDACVIDVRNAFETEIGRMVPPKNGAEFIDPKIRNSHEFPRWLALPETQAKLNSKSTILMYCTGGIRCERASALLDTLQEKKISEPCINAKMSSDIMSKQDIKAEIVMVQGGIERYLRAFPDGGFWRGANYLFDRRLEQWPTAAQTHQSLGSCALCAQACNEYRGKFFCTSSQCADAKVPVIVCRLCRPKANPDAIFCALCRTGYHGARNAPKPELEISQPIAHQEDETPAVKRRRTNNTDIPTQFLFVGNIPLTTNRTLLLNALGASEDNIHVYWLADRTTCLFYGSAIIDTGNSTLAASIIHSTRKPSLDGRTLRLGFYRAQRAPEAFYSTAQTPPVHRKY